MENLEIRSAKKNIFKRKAFIIPAAVLLSVGLVLAAYTLIFSVHISGNVLESISGSDTSVSLSPMYTGEFQTGNFTVTNNANVNEQSVIDWLNLGTTNDISVQVSLNNSNFVDISTLGMNGFLETWYPGANTVYWKITYTGNQVGDTILGDIQVNSQLQSQPLVNVTYNITNDPDSGNGPYWGLDNITRNLVIYKQALQMNIES